MKITRRGFVKFGIASGAAIAIGDRLFANADELGLGGKGVAIDKSKIKGADFDKVVPYTCLVCNVEDGGLAYIKRRKGQKAWREMTSTYLQGEGSAQKAMQACGISMTQTGYSIH